MGRTAGTGRRIYDGAFRREAVRILTAGEPTVPQVAAGLGIGRSTLSAWKPELVEARLLAGPHDHVQKELARVRREKGLLRARRDLLKKRPPSLPRRRSRLRQRESR